MCVCVCVCVSLSLSMCACVRFLVILSANGFTRERPRGLPLYFLRVLGYAESQTLMFSASVAWSTRARVLVGCLKRLFGSLPCYLYRSSYTYACACASSWLTCPSDFCSGSVGASYWVSLLHESLSLIILLLYPVDPTRRDSSAFYCYCRC